MAASNYNLGWSTGSWVHGRDVSRLDDLQVIGFKDFNPMWTFPTTAVNQCWEPMTFGMAPWHLSENADKQKSKEALQTQCPIAAFKACNMIQALGIAYSKIVLPSGDSKAESKGRTYCPTTWSYSYQWTYASQYADQLRKEAEASALLCKECTLLVRIQLSNKSATHPNCAFADSMSTAMCGAMISLTPRIASSVDRDCDLHEFAEFGNAADMIQKLNDILAKPDGFPQIPAPRKECHTFWTEPKQRHKQYVICPEQDPECLVYMSDQSTSMVEALGIHDHPWWRQRVEDFYGWYTKSDRSVKTSKDAWTWDEGSTCKWSTTYTRGSSKRGQSVPVDPSNAFRIQRRKVFHGETLDEMDTSHAFLYP